MTERTVVGDMEYALSPLTSSLGFLTRVVQIQLSDRLRASGGLGRSPAVLSALRLIDTNPGIRQMHAARILLIHESNMAILIKDLIAQGLVERRGGTGGKRGGGLRITEDGRREVEKAAPAEVNSRSYVAVLSDKEHQQLITLLSRVYRAALSQ